MQKHIFRAIIMVFVFIGAVFLFGRNLGEEKISANATIKMRRASLPLAVVWTGSVQANILHGYVNNIDANQIRENITPLDEAQEFELEIADVGNDIKKIEYSVYDTYTGVLLEEKTTHALQKSESGKKVKIRLGTELQAGREYALKITAVTSKSKKINYYTRIKRIQDGHMKEKIDFALDIHKSLLNKENAENVIRYLEPDYSNDYSDLSHVTIQSDFNTVSYADLKPKVISKVIPSIKECNTETASVVLNYVLEGKTGDGTERYNVSEYFRVKYTSDRMYLLDYDRTMESIFDFKHSSLSRNELKFGIMNKTDIDLFTSSDKNKLCFVHGQELWYYDLEENSGVRVFSFPGGGKDYLREYYNRHDIKILNMDDEGNIDFMVYGYMNRGDYEGKVGILLYRFYEEENRIEEQTYVPADTSFELLKDDLNESCYVNQDQVFYFCLNYVIYSYHIPSGSLKTIASDMQEGSFLLSREGKFLVWQDSKEPGKATKITMMDLETGAPKVISAPKGKNIKILGSLDDALIYGFGNIGDIGKLPDGTVIQPVKDIRIVDRKNTQRKRYIPKSYVLSAAVKDNIIELICVKKTAGIKQYQIIEPDYILNNTVEDSEGFLISKRVTDKALTEYYLSMPSEFTMKQKPSVQDTLNTILTKNSVLRLDEDFRIRNKYYVYALDGITGSYSDPAEAIQKADEQMGFVMNGKQQIVWERGGKYIRNQIDGIQIVSAVGEKESMAACIRMILGFNGIQVKAEQIDLKKQTAARILDDYLKAEGLRLTGCSLEQILYYVGKNRPVIAVKDTKSSILLIGYDELNVYYINPETGQESKMGLKTAEKTFQDAGNQFITYMAQ